MPLYVLPVKKDQQNREQKVPVLRCPSAVYVIGLAAFDPGHHRKVFKMKGTLNQKRKIECATIMTRSDREIFYMLDNRLNPVHQTILQCFRMFEEFSTGMISISIEDVVAFTGLKATVIRNSIKEMESLGVIDTDGEENGEFDYICRVPVDELYFDYKTCSVDTTFYRSLEHKKIASGLFLLRKANYQETFYLTDIDVEILAYEARMFQARFDVINKGYPNLKVGISLALSNENEDPSPVERITNYMRDRSTPLPPYEIFSRLGLCPEAGNRALTVLCADDTFQESNGTVKFAPKFSRIGFLSQVHHAQLEGEVR